MAKKKEKPLYDENGRWAEEKRMCIGALRRLFRQSPQFKEVHEGSRVEIPRYNKNGLRAKKDYVKRTCQVCGGLFGSGNIAIDHIDPLIPLHLTDADLSYDEIVNRLFCNKSNLQRICNPKKGKKNKPKFLEFCHQKKNHEDSFIRGKWKDRFESKGIIGRKNKDTEYDLFKDIEKEWKNEYLAYLERRIKEEEEKEEKRRKKNKK